MNPARCDRHTKNLTFPKGCAICERINVEQDIVRRTVHALLEAGYQLNVNNGGDDDELPHYSADVNTILETLMATDSEFLLARKPYGGDTKWVRFVYGNDGWDVIADYLMSLESVLAPIMDYASALGDR